MDANTKALLRKGIDDGIAAFGAEVFKNLATRHVDGHPEQAEQFVATMTKAQALREEVLTRLAAAPAA